MAGSKRSEKRHALYNGHRSGRAVNSRSGAQKSGGINLKNTRINNANRVLGKESTGPGKMRSKSDQARVKMYAEKLTAEKKKANAKEPEHMIQIKPDRKWFMNTRVITQSKLDQFRTALENVKEDPYSVVIKKSKVPLALFDHRDEVEDKRSSKLLTFEGFDDIIAHGGSKKRKKLRQANSIGNDFADYVAKAELKHEEYQAENDTAIKPDVYKCGNIVQKDIDRYEAREECMKKGTSRRIWQELYKVVDSSDVIVYVLDARNPMGTRCRALETYIRKDKPNKHQILILNKVDLVPNSVTEKWIRLLKHDLPTLGFASSINHGFGRKTFVNLLRQYAKLMSDRKHISIGFVGYPNVGKSSVINALKGKIVCKTAPIPGETKVWQYISLTSRVHLIDCPGVVPSDPNDEVSLVMKGIVRAEKLDQPECFIPKVLELVKEEHLRKRYRLQSDFHWTDKNTDEPDSIEFLKALGKKLGKLGPGGEPDIKQVAIMVLHDWQRGKLPYFIMPPKTNIEEDIEENDNE